MGSFSVAHWVIVLVVVLLVFGTKKLASAGTDLGRAVKGFKDGVNGLEQQAGELPPPQAQEAEGKQKG